MLQSLLKKIINKKPVNDNNSMFYTSSSGQVKGRKRSHSEPIIFNDKINVLSLTASKSCPQEIDCTFICDNKKMETKLEDKDIVDEELFKLEIDQNSTNSDETTSDDIKTVAHSKRLIFNI